MTSITNEQMFKNVITIIKQMDISKENNLDTKVNKVIEQNKKNTSH